MCVTLAKIILVVFNIMWVLMGFIMVVLGCLIKFGLNTFMPLLKQSLSQAESQGVDISSADDFINYFTTSVAVPIIVLGAFFLIIGLLGCIGACCSSKYILIAYSIVVGVFVVAEIGLAIGLYFKESEVKATISKEVQKHIDSDYKDVSNQTELMQSPFSVVFNILMIEGKCCGLTDKSNFNSSTSWNRNFEFTVNNKKTTVELAYPLACCKMNGTFPKYQPVDGQGCVTSPSSQNANLDIACWNYVDGLVNANKTYVIVAYALGIFFQIFLIICAIIICRDESKVLPI